MKVSSFNFFRSFGSVAPKRCNSRKASGWYVTLPTHHDEALQYVWSKLLICSFHERLVCFSAEQMFLTRSLLLTDILYSLIHYVSNSLLGPPCDDKSLTNATRSKCLVGLLKVKTIRKLVS